ncbi:hypothetical protein [Staphylococcus agnetis]|uniref:hypothetical protein n=1 Tax=Staphylococcus agnetis TaxID=985762 RepID=UPI0014312A8D|nr:hypothetical protein [Staphylococcus agnetis]NJH67209.1 hypothetical protein [Staphylococcus agnetis]
MRFYKVFKNIHKKELELLEYNPNLDYQSYLDENRRIGNLNLILNTKILIKVALVLIEKDYKFTNIELQESPFIDVEDYSFKNINTLYKLNELSEEFLNDNGYVIKIKEIKFVNHLTLEGITIKSNGIIIFENTSTNESVNQLSKILNEIFGVDCYANI